MAISVGEIEATLRLKDQMSPEFAAATARMNQSIGQMQIGINAAKQNVNDLTKAIKEYGQAAAQKAGLDTQLGAAKVQATQLTAQMREVNKAIADHATGATQAKQSAEELARAEKAAADATREVEAAQNAAKKAAEAHEAAIAKLGQAFTSAGTAMRSTGLILSAAITAPIVGIGVASEKFAADFQTQMTRVQTLAGASGEEVASLRQQVLDLAPAVGVGPAELAKGLFVAESATFRGAAAMDVLTHAAKMSALGMGETEDVTRALVGAMLSYKEQNLSAAEASDVLVKAVQLGNVKIDELVPALARVNPIAAAMGVKFQDVAAAIATFTHMGASASVAATGLRAILSNILTDSAKTEKGFKELANTVHDSSISMENFRKDIADKGLTQALLDLMDKANLAGEKGLDSLNKIFPNVRALTEVLAIAKANGELYLQTADGIMNANGVLESGFEVLKKTADQQFAEMVAELKKDAIMIGDELLPRLTEFFNYLKENVFPAIEKLIEWFEGLPKPVKDAALEFAAFAALVGPALIVFGTLAGAIGNLITLYVNLREAIILAKAAGLGGAISGAAGTVGAGAAATGAGALGGLAVGALTGIGSPFMLAGDVGAQHGIKTPQDAARFLRGEDERPLVEFLQQGIESGLIQPNATPVMPGSRSITPGVGPGWVTESLFGAGAGAGAGTPPKPPKELSDEQIKTQRDDVGAEIRKINETMSKLDEQALKVQQSEEMADVKSQIQFIDNMHERVLTGRTFDYPKFADNAKTPGFASSLFSDIGKDLPQLIVGALQGGGSAIKSVAAGFGNQVGSNLVASFGKSITDTLGKTFGGAINSILPGLGALAAPLIGFIGKVFGKSEESSKVSPIRDEFFKLQGGLETLNPRILQATGSLKLVDAVFKAKTVDQYNAAIKDVNNALEVFRQKLDAVTKAAGEVSGKLSTMTSMSPEVKEAMQAALNAKTPEEYAAALANVNGLLDEQAQKHQHLKDLAGKYGISLKDMGQAFKQGEVDAQSKVLLEDFADLTAAGVDATAIIKGMSGEYSKLVQNAIDTGAELPESMKPTLQKLIDMGLLVDGTGKKFTSLDGLKFGDTLEQNLKDIKKVVDDLKGAIENLAAAWRGLPDPRNAPSPPPGPPSQGDGESTPSGGGSSPDPGSPDFGGFSGSGSPDDGGYYYPSWRGGVMPGGVRHMRMGGWIPSGQDTVRALLAPGEGVVNHMGMGTLGVGGLNTLNHGGSLQMSSGGNTYYITIHANDAKSFADMMRRPGGGIDVLIDDAKFDKRGRGTKLSRALE